MESFNLMYRHPKPVVKAATTDHDFDFDDDLFDRVLGRPDKIDIPERYIPEAEPEVGPEEERRRSEKAEAICRLLSKSAVGSGGGIARLPLLLPQRRPIQTSQPIQQHPSPSTVAYRNGTGSSNGSSATTSGFGSGTSSRLSGVLSTTSLPSSPHKRGAAPLRKGAAEVVNGSNRNSRRSTLSSPSECDWSLAGVNAPSTPYIYRDSSNYTSGKYSSVPSYSSQKKVISSRCSHLNSIASQSVPLSYSSLQSHQRQHPAYHRSSSPDQNYSDYVYQNRVSQERRHPSRHLSPIPPSHSYHSSYSSTSSGSSDREDLLHLQQSLAKQVAGRALGSSPSLYGASPTPRRSPYRPPTPPSPVHLPTVQQREGFFT